MWSYIKKSINSNFAKPLNEKMDDNKIPNLPQYAEFLDLTANINAYYTLVDVTSGSGLLYKVVCYCKTSSGDIKIKFTVDSIVTELTFERLHANAEFEIDGGDLYNDNLVIYNCLIDFKNSLKIEVLTTSGSGNTFSAIANFGLRT